MCCPGHVFPSSFYNGVIIPILKKPTLDPNRPENYRPITLSSVHSKVIESIKYQRLMHVYMIINLVLDQVDLHLKHVVS